jgi:predicted lipoprotein with Yx(FWY)xxD motif
MKKRILLFTATAGIIGLTLTSESIGPARSTAGNRTGAQGSITTCGGGGSSCHNGTGAATTVTITVDSGSTAVTRYVPGMTYTVKIHGTNTSLLMHFGFEFASVSGTGTSQIQAGTASGFPTNVAADVTSGLTIVEHHAALAATSAGVYDVSFTWAAPTTGVGNITLYSTLNAVVGDDNVSDAADASNNTSLVLTQEAASTSVASVTSNITMSAFPNPVTNELHLAITEAGTYSVQAYDLSGRSVSNENITVNGAPASINTANWATGMYIVEVSKDGNSQFLHIVKN